MSSELPSLLVCGPQTVVPSSGYLSTLRDQVKKNPILHRAVFELPQLWPTLRVSNPSLDRVPGQKLLDSLRSWIQEDGSSLPPEGAAYNVLLGPLTVIIQVVGYLEFINKLGGDNSHGRVIEAVRSGGVQGLCIGFLTAAALVSSQNQVEISQNVAVAMRLAAAIGAHIDLGQETSPAGDRATSFTVRWTSLMNRERIISVISQYEKAYVPVWSDTTSATITVRETDSSDIVHDLSELGVESRKLTLAGRFHHSMNTNAANELCDLCASTSLLQFPHPSQLLAPLRCNDSGQCIPLDQPLHEIAVRSLMVETADWYSTMLAATNAIGKGRSPQKALVSTLGLVDCVPRSIATIPDQPVSYIRVSPKFSSGPHTEISLAHGSEPSYTYPEDAIAIIGAACRFPGADSLEELWELIKAGSSTIQACPQDRFHPSRVRPGKSNEPVQGNFVKGADMFDHRFFGTSPREAMFLDPQQRIALEVAYQAVESSGLLSDPIPPRDIGCFTGVSACDYEQEYVSTHAPSAYSFPGTGPSFISGRISHHFNWTGPSLVINNACTSSGVAIHLACRALQSGDCSIALAGGVNMIASRTYHENLEAANLLSKTGPCRPFDANTSGYCRGEGCGFVLLKRLSRAISDGDHIHAVIAGSAVNQNESSSAITVPVSASQADLYKRVLQEASMDAGCVSYVEAHGTGTPRGDPIECRSIESVFGGSQNQQNLYLGSIKANIGHTEAASGLAGLLKVLLMIKHRKIPPQALFETLNPAIAPLDDRIIIPTKTLDWSTSFRAACVNNYGASGSNTSLIICQPPTDHIRPSTTALVAYPISISAQSQESLGQYCKVLSEFSHQNSMGIASVAFSLAQRENLRHSHRCTFKARTVQELQNLLIDKCHRLRSPSNPMRPAEKPVTLVFAGQAGGPVFLSEDIYRSSTLLRSHLDSCHKIMKALDLPSLYPAVFQCNARHDIVSLHCTLFAIQYSCAATWLDSGLKVARLVGHSFGQLTALCVSGVIGLRDAVRLIAGRAQLIQSSREVESGCMLRIDADLPKIHSIIKAAHHPRLEIACYNAPTSHVLVGPEAAIRAVEKLGNSDLCSGVRMRRLNTTHGFHSELIDSILPQYLQLARSLTYHPARIPIETCSETVTWPEATAELVARHSRLPVHFSAAISRVECDLGPCTWIEAGSGAGGITLAQRALGPECASTHSFYSVQLTADDPKVSLVDTTIHMWNDGVKVQFWMYHRSEKQHFEHVDLPPYQFEKHSHWLPIQQSPPPERKHTLCQETFESVRSHYSTNRSNNNRAFEISLAPYGRRTSSVDVPLCWSRLPYLEAILQNSGSLLPANDSSIHFPRLEDIRVYQCPRIVQQDATDSVLILQRKESLSWDFTVGSAKKSIINRTVYASGTIYWDKARCPRVIARQSRIQRLMNYKRCHMPLTSSHSSVLRGNVLYRTLTQQLSFLTPVPELECVTIACDEAVAHTAIWRAAIGYSNEAGLAAAAFERLWFLGTVLVNLVENNQGDPIYSPDSVDEAVFLCAAEQTNNRPWAVHTCSEHLDSGTVVSDVIAYDADLKRPMFAIFGLHFQRITSSTHSMYDRVEITRPIRSQLPPSAPTSRARTLVDASKVHTPTTTVSNAEPRLRRLFHTSLGVDPNQITSTTYLKELGIDSLAAIELQRQIKDLFQVDLSFCGVELDWSFGDLCRELYRHLDITSTIDDQNATSSQDAQSHAPIQHYVSANVLSTTGARPDLPPDKITQQLSGLLSTHLNMPPSVSPHLCLFESGLDSLAALDLGLDLMKTFGVKLDLMTLPPDLTVSDLEAVILGQQGIQGA
ncbi:hypothetical protein BJX99DRAFT_263213 [Aspergillus californicus]